MALFYGGKTVEDILIVSFFTILILFFITIIILANERRKSHPLRDRSLVATNIIFFCIVLFMSKSFLLISSFGKGVCSYIYLLTDIFSFMTLNLIFLYRIFMTVMEEKTYKNRYIVRIAKLYERFATLGILYCCLIVSFILFLIAFPMLLIPAWKKDALNPIEDRNQHVFLEEIYFVFVYGFVVLIEAIMLVYVKSSEKKKDYFIFVLISFLILVFYWTFSPKAINNEFPISFLISAVFSLTEFYTILFLPTYRSIQYEINVELENAVYVDKKLYEILNNPKRKKKFRKHLEKEFSTENLDFYEAYISYFKECKLHPYRNGKKRTNFIYNKFIGLEAEFPIIISGAMKQEIERKISKGCTDPLIFHDIASETVKSMSLDSLARFDENMY